MDSTTEVVFKRLEETQNEFWNVARETGNFLNMLVKICNAQNAYEIGTSNGYSGIWLAKALKETGGHLTTIEFYEKRQSIAKENFKICGVDDVVRPIQGSACEVLASFDENEKFDFVFIDACKREYVKYFEMIKPHLTPKALIVADNIISHAEKVQDFIDAVDADDEFQYEILEIPGGILVAYRG